MTPPIPTYLGLLEAFLTFINRMLELVGKWITEHIFTRKIQLTDGILLEHAVHIGLKIEQGFALCRDISNLFSVWARRWTVAAVPHPHLGVEVGEVKPSGLF